MKLWILLICLLFSAGVANAKTAQPSQREQLGIKKLPKTEKEILQYTGVFLKHGWSPDWSGINKTLIKKTFQVAFDRKGKIKPKWVERWRRILKESDIGTLSNPIPPEKQGEKWQFALNTYHGTQVIWFNVTSSADPITVTNHSFLEPVIK